MAVALVAAALSVGGAPPASADHGRTNDVWAATLTVPGPLGGCNNAFNGHECSSTSALTDDDFTHAGVDYAITILTVVNGILALTLDKAIPAAIRSDGTLHVNGSPFRLSNATFTNSNATATWSNSGLSWPQGQQVNLKLTAPYWTGVDLYGGGMVHQADGYQYMDLNEGNNGTFRVRLDQAPTAEVTITIGKLSTFEIDDFDAATVSPQTLTFTTSNWQTGQSVTVTAATDGDGDDDRIIISARVSIASSADADDPYRNPERVNGFVLTVKDTTVGGG